MRLGDGGLSLVSYHGFPVTLGGLLHLSFHISSASLRIIHISLPVFCLSCFNFCGIKAAIYACTYDSAYWCYVFLTVIQRLLMLVPELSQLINVPLLQIQ